MNAAELPATLDAIATLIERGDCAAAERRAQRALQTLPPHAEVWRLLAIAQIRLDRLDAALRSLQQAARLDPASVEILCNLAAISIRHGNHAAAIETLERALQLDRDHLGALTNLGRLRHQLGDYHAAARCFERSLRIAPKRAESWFDLANTSAALHAWEAAASHVRQGLALNPRAADGWYVLGYVYERQGRLDEALEPYRNSMALHPRAHTAHNLALVLEQRGDWLAAARMLEQALQLEPNLHEALGQLVFAKRKLCEWDGLPALSARMIAAVDAGVEGITAFSFLAEDATPAQQLHCARSFAKPFAQGVQYTQDARQGIPSSPTASSLGERAQGEGALSSHAAQSPPHPTLSPDVVGGEGLNTHVTGDGSNLRGAGGGANLRGAGEGLNAQDSRSEQAAQRPIPSPPTASSLGERAQGEGALSSHAAQSPPHPTLSPDVVGGEGLNTHVTGEGLNTHVAGERLNPRGARNDLNLRVGFVSSGFSEHATGLLVVELIERLRASSLTAIAFATTASDHSALRHRLNQAFDEFHEVAQQPPEAIAQRIRDARIDVLIDVDGYCMNSQPRIFALRPSPIQINWLAYPGSLGAPWYDYLIADDCVIPAAQRAHYDEKIAYLPRCYQPTDTTRSVPEAPARAALGLPADGFVYCCFNATWKITPQRFALWLRILAAVPGSVLWLLDERPDSGVVERLRVAAQRGGIDPQRMIFAPKAGHADYLARYRHADLFLDTSPYNAHTTASDAIYAGCPVLTRCGDTFASRVAASLNRQLGMHELTVTDDETYLALAIELARQPARMDALRARVRDPATRARLFDMQAYAEDFAALIQRIAARARSNEPPQDISL